MRNILIVRCDASSEIGTGHIMRMLALAQAWQDMHANGGERAAHNENGDKPHVVFICARLPKGLMQQLQVEGFKVILINATPGSSEDFQQTLKAISRYRLKNLPHAQTTWVVIDGYAFDVTYHCAIRSAGFKLLVVDDCNHLPAYECDILLNQNLGAAEYAYHINPDAKLLLGPRYCLFRREFRIVKQKNPQTRKLHDKQLIAIIDGPCETDWKNQNQRSHAFKKNNGTSCTNGPNILVTMGGADRHNVTLKIIEALNKSKIKGLNVKILAGTANQNIERLKMAITSFPFHVEGKVPPMQGEAQINYQLINHTQNMPDLIRWADVAICAGGSTCWEFCLLNVPMILVALADNQRRIIDRLTSIGVGRYGKEWSKIETKSLTHEIDTLVKQLSSHTDSFMQDKLLIDQYGALRVLESMCPTSHTELIFRPANACDMILYYNWTNEPTVRASAINSGHISLNEHRAWFHGRLRDPKSHLWVLVANGLPVGQIRLDTEKSHAWLDYSLDPVVRGRGWGKILVRDGIKHFPGRYYYSILAKVKPNNKISTAIMKSTGFKMIGGEDIKLYKLSLCKPDQGAISSEAAFCDV